MEGGFVRSFVQSADISKIGLPLAHDGHSLLDLTVEAENRVRLKEKKKPCRERGERFKKKKKNRVVRGERDLYICKMFTVYNS